MKKIFLVANFIGFSLFLPDLCCTVYGQFFSRSQDTRPEEPGGRPFQIFSGRGFSDSSKQSEDPPRLFRGWGMRETDSRPNPTANGTGSTIFGGRGMAGIPFDDGRSFSNEPNWTDVDASENQRWPFRRFGQSWNQSEMRSARRFEMDERPRWFGNRASLYDDDSDELNWFERMNQRSRDFWSESTYRMQERNQAMRAKRQETWDSITRGFRPTTDQNEFDLPPFEDDATLPSRKGSAIDRF